MPEPGRQAGHVILDALSVFSPDDATSAAVDLALARLTEVGALTATIDDDDVVTVDASDLVASVLVLMTRLITENQLLRGIGDEEIIVELRELLDE